MSEDNIIRPAPSPVNTPPVSPREEGSATQKKLSKLAIFANATLPSRHIFDSQHFKVEDSCRMTTLKILLFVPRLWIEWMVTTAICSILMTLGTFLLLVFVLPTAVTYYDQHCGKESSAQKNRSWYVKNCNLQRFLVNNPAQG